MVHKHLEAINFASETRMQVPTKTKSSGRTEGSYDLQSHVEALDHIYQLNICIPVIMAWLVFNYAPPEVRHDAAR
jgi:hypothetical protein